MRRCARNPFGRVPAAVLPSHFFHSYHRSRRQLYTECCKTLISNKREGQSRGLYWRLSQWTGKLERSPSSFYCSDGTSSGGCCRTRLHFRGCCAVDTGGALRLIRDENSENPAPAPGYRRNSKQKQIPVSESGLIVKLEFWILCGPLSESYHFKTIHVWRAALGLK